MYRYIKLSEKHEQYLQRVSSLCEGWFGPVPDDASPIRVVLSDRVGLSRTWFSNEYLLYVDSECPPDEELVAILGHELYHRFSKSKRGLHRIAWVDETIACATELQVLTAFGFIEQVNRAIEFSLRDCQRMSPVEFRRWNQYAFGLFRGYRPGYHSAAVVLSKGLMDFLPWSTMCALTDHRGWNSWFRLIPLQTRDIVYQLLLG